VRDQVFLAEVLRVGFDDLRAAGVTVLLLQVLDVVADDEVDLAGVREQVFELGDLLDQVLVFGEERVSVS